MRKKNNTYHRILVVKFRYHGDMLLTTPLISTLKKWYPDSLIDVLLYEDTLPILVNNPHVNQFYTLSRRTKRSFDKIRQAFSVTKKLKQNNYDLVINLADQWPIAFMTSLLPSYRIGINRGDNVKGKLWASFFDETIKINKNQHIVLQNLSMLSTLGHHDNNEVMNLSMYYRERDAEILSSLPPAFAGRYIVVQPTTRQAYKYWDNDKFATVIDHFSSRGFGVVMTCGPDQHEKAVVNDIARQCTQPPYTALAGETNFSELAALIDHATLYIGLDSAPMHMAAALNTPVVALFGPTDYQLWRPWTTHYKQLWAGNYEKMPESADYDKTIKYLSCVPASDVIDAGEALLKENDGEENGNSFLSV